MGDNENSCENTTKKTLIARKEGKKERKKESGRSVVCSARLAYR
jgi:hypothetical protein